MASTEFGTNSPQAVKRWSEQLMRETFGHMEMRTLIGRGDEACITLKTELDREAGDTIKCDLLIQDRSDGVNGDSELIGHEVPLVYYQDELSINQKRNAHEFKGMSQQRTVHDLRQNARFSLGQWYAWVIEAGIIAHMVGVTGDGNESVFGVLGGDTGDADFAGNVITALDAGHLVDGTAGTMTVGLIDDAVAKAKVNNPRVAPIMVNGKKMFICYLHPYQVRSLRQDAGAAQWNEIMQNAQVRGDQNPIFTGSIGVYNNAVLRESEFVPSTGDVRHAVMMGAGAGSIGFGNAHSKSRRSTSGGGSFFDWHEEVNDYGNAQGVGASSILGFKGSQYNGEAFGRIGINSTDAAPA